MKSGQIVYSVAAAVSEGFAGKREKKLLGEQLTERLPFLSSFLKAGIHGGRKALK